MDLDIVGPACLAFGLLFWIALTSMQAARARRPKEIKQEWMKPD